MSKLNRILEAGRRYTFSEYFDLPFTARDIVRGFGYTLEQKPLELQWLKVQPDLSLLHQIIERNRRRTRLENEQAKRSALVAPILVEVCELNDLEIDTEYAVSVSDHLTGVIDYRIEAEASLLVVEAKQSDLVRGFKQLSAEMIASHYWIDERSPSIYGCTTDGERWQFAVLIRSADRIEQDTRVYSIEQLEDLVRTIAGIVESD